LPSLPPPLPTPTAAYNESCYFTPNVDFTWTGAPLQGISSDTGFAEASLLCLERSDCFAIIENDFENNLLPQKRYVLRGQGELQAEAGTTTLVRNVNRCKPAPPPSPTSPPPLPPSHPILRMQTRPLYLVSFQATVQTTVEAFDVPAYAQRMRTALDVQDVGVRVAPGSVVVTTEAGADSQVAADELVSEITNTASDPAALAALYGAPAEVDLNSISVSQNPDAAMPPPSGPPPARTEEEHSYLALIIILCIIVPVGAFLLYLHLEHNTRNSSSSKEKPQVARKPYAPVTTTDLQPLPFQNTKEISFKFQM